MWLTAIPTKDGYEIINCKYDLGNWEYRCAQYRQEVLRKDFPMLPTDYEGDCNHRVGIENGDKFHCCVCGYTVLKKDIKK